MDTWQKGVADSRWASPPVVVVVVDEKKHIKHLLTFPKVFGGIVLLLYVMMLAYIPYRSHLSLVLPPQEAASNQNKGHLGFSR